MMHDVLAVVTDIHWLATGPLVLGSARL